MSDSASLEWRGETPKGVRWPAPIPPGGAIGLFAPAHTFDRAEMERGANLLRSWGFEVKFSRAIFKRRGYLAGGDEERLAVMDELMNDDSVAALMAARGGFGCQRLLPLLERCWNRWPDKPILGFSDLTALHLARLKAAGVVGCHSPMAVSLGKLEASKMPDKASLGDLKRFLRTNALNGRWKFSPRDVARPGEAGGALVGGNLTLFLALLSSPFMPDLTGAILLLEDVGEPGYKLDRLLATFRQSRAFGQAAGLVFGRFAQCGPPRFVRALLSELAKDFAGPVFLNAPFGHGAGNRFFPIGPLATMKGD